jgi:hypothetical protein
MNKKGLEFKLAFLALIVVGMCVVAIGDWIIKWEQDYDSDITYDLDSFNKIDAVSGDTRSMEEKIAIKTADTSTDFEGTSIRGVWGILNNIKNSFRMVFGENGMIDAISERFSVPAYIGYGLVAAMSIVIVFTLVAIFFRLSRRNV